MSDFPTDPNPQSDAEIAVEVTSDLVKLEQEHEELREELRELLQQWRDKAHQSREEGLNGYHHGVKECAEELEGLLNANE